MVADAVPTTSLPSVPSPTTFGVWSGKSQKNRSVLSVCDYSCTCTKENTKEKGTCKRCYLILCSCQSLQVKQTRALWLPPVVTVLWGLRALTHLSVTAPHLHDAQKADPSLKGCFSKVVSNSNATNKQIAYYIDEDLLMRRWSPSVATDAKWSVVCQCRERKSESGL